MDVDPPKFDQLIIKGTVVVAEDIGDVTIEANNIWIKGKLRAGKENSPFPNNLTIKIYGKKDDRGMPIDEF